MLTTGTDTRPQKRARLSHVAESRSGLRRHPEFYFDDGNIILVAQHFVFRIYRGLLASQSTIFADMFASSTSCPDEVLEECPLVQLTDSPHDLTHLLRVLLPKSPIHYHVADTGLVHTFDELSAVIRLAHKYDIQSVQDQALRALQRYHFTSDFNAFWGPPDESIAVEPVHAIGAVNLARLTDTPSMLPLALYRCCYLGRELFDGWKREDGTVEQLSLADVMRCVDACGTLQLLRRFLVVRIFRLSARCASQAACTLKILVVAQAVTRVAGQNGVLVDWSEPLEELTRAHRGARRARGR